MFYLFNIKYFKILKTKQYLKNLLILFPVFFAKELNLLFNVNIIFVLFGFSLICSSVYIMNDLFDLNDDKLHPRKKFRPLASKSISLKNAKIYLILLFIIGIIILTKVDSIFFFFSIFYFLINFLYSYKLKHFPFIDIICISLGFIVRLLIGSYFFNLHLTIWIILLTLLLTSYVIMLKRKVDFKNISYSSKLDRISSFYNSSYLNMIIYANGFIICLFYTLYLYYTKDFINNAVISICEILLVGISLFRFYIINNLNKKFYSPISIFLKDRIMLVLFGAWFFLGIDLIK